MWPTTLDLKMLTSNSLSANRRICLRDLEHGVGIHGFTLTWPSLTIEICALLSNHTRNETMRNVSAYKLPRYYQPQRVSSQPHKLAFAKNFDSPKCINFWVFEMNHLRCLLLRSADLLLVQELIWIFIWKDMFTRNIFSHSDQEVNYLAIPGLV